MAINFVPLWNLYKSRLVDDLENPNELYLFIQILFLYFTLWIAVTTILSQELIQNIVQN